MGETRCVRVYRNPGTGRWVTACRSCGRVWTGYSKWRTAYLFATIHIGEYSRSAGFRAMD